MCACIQNSKYLSSPRRNHGRKEYYFARNDSLDWTRIALGAGIGMLISRRLSKDAMKAAGFAMTMVGGFTTIPLAIAILGKKNLTRPEIRSVA
jgi:hypothetical protein